MKRKNSESASSLGGSFNIPNKGKLSELAGSWKMSEEESKRIFGNLAKSWKKKAKKLKLGIC